MKKEELAALLNGREYGDEMTKAEELEAKQSGLVIVFGYSDDNAEFRGVISDEVGASGDRLIYFNHNGLLKDHEDRCECPYCGYEAAKQLCKSIWPKWSVLGYSWMYHADFPHATFDIMEDGNTYCRGIVFSMEDL